MEPAPVVDPTPTTGGCPFPHAALAGTSAASRHVVEAPVVADVSPAVEAGRCPVAHDAPAAAPAGATIAPGCPIRHDGSAVHRSKADLFVRRLLRIKERPAGQSAASAYAIFQRSMIISATRCTLTYVLFPIVFPLIGIAKGMGPIVGVFVGSFAIVCDTFTIRRFFSVDHKYRWYFSAIALSIIGLLLFLLVQDWIDLLS